MSNDSLQRPVIWILANTTWNIYNFRRRLIASLQEAGYDIVACAPPDDYVGRLEALGVRHVPLYLRNSSVGPVRELVTLARLVALVRRERPAVMLSYTPKVNIYAGIAARIADVPIVMNISGLGRAFTSGRALRRISESLYRLAVRRADRVLFQNEEDRKHFIERGIVEAARTERIPGSGVDLERFKPTTRAPAPGVHFLMATRILRDKGVVEFIEAARALAPHYPLATFRLVGFLGVDNPSAVSAAELSRWQSEGIIEWAGATDRIEDEFERADCVVLPSYREGLPRVLLEAAASGLPIITTRAIGCRDTVDDGVTGLLCEPRDAAGLASAMDRMINMGRAEREAMGAAGRRKVEQEFDEKVVIGRYVELLANITPRPPPRTDRPFHRSPAAPGR